MPVFGQGKFVRVYGGRQGKLEVYKKDVNGFGKENAALT
jgi:hypothetical protein